MSGLLPASAPQTGRRGNSSGGPDGQPTGGLRGANLSHTFVFPKSRGRFTGQFSSELIAILGVGATTLGVGIAIMRLVLQQGGRIDALALRMDERDRRTDDRFGQVNEQYRQLTEHMNERFQQLTERTDDRFRQLTERTDDRFGQANEQYRQLTEHMNERFQQQADQTNERFRQLTEHMNERFQQQADQMNEQFRKLSERVARVEGKFELLETLVEHRKEPLVEAAE